MKVAPLVAGVLLACASTAAADDRPFVWAVDPNGPRDTEVEAVYQLTTAAGTSGAVRYLSAGSPGVLQQLGADVALTPWVTVGAYGLVSLGAPVDDPVNATAGGYAHFTLVRPEPGEPGGTFGLMVSGVRELPAEHDDVLALSAWVLGGYEHRPVYIAGNLQVERRFVSEADPLDVMVRVGVMTEIADGLRVGPEYIGQDLEDYLENEEEAEGGAVHLVAASLALYLPDEGLNLGISPGLVVARGEVGFGGAFDASVRFYSW